MIIRDWSTIMIDQEWGPRWSDRPVSRFEARGIEAGRQIFDLSYSRAR